jgi:hypothetical protein
MQMIEYVDKKGNRVFARFLGLVKINGINHAKVIYEKRPGLIHWDHILDYCRDALKKEFNLDESSSGKTQKSGQ